MVLRWDESDDRENKDPKELDGLLSKYQRGNAMEKLVTLSLIDHTKYTNKKISKIFGCSLYKVKKVLSLSKEEWHIPKKEKIMRSKLDINKCDNFSYHLFDNEMIQEVAFGIM